MLFVILLPTDQKALEVEKSSSYLAWCETAEGPIYFNDVIPIVYFITIRPTYGIFISDSRPAQNERQPIRSTFDAWRQRTDVLNGVL